MNDLLSISVNTAVLIFGIALSSTFIMLVALIASTYSSTKSYIEYRKLKEKSVDLDLF